MFKPQNIFALVIAGLGFIAGAQVTNTTVATADAFLCTGSVNYQGGADLTALNFGGAGTLAIAPASAAKGGFKSVIKFNLSNSVALFDAAYGSNGWRISSASLELASNYGLAGMQPNNPIFNAINPGKFVIEWMADDSWVEGTGNPSQPATDGITARQLPDYLVQYHVPLCTNTYTPPGANVPLPWSLPLETNLVADIIGGGEVSFYFYAADDQIGYLFNSYRYGRGNEPLLHVAATALPVSLPIISGAFSNGVFRLTGLGRAAAAYKIQANTHLSMTNWVALGTCTAGTNGVLQFDDAGATNAQRFYRLSQ